VGSQNRLETSCGLDIRLILGWFDARGMSCRTNCKSDVPIRSRRACHHDTMNSTWEEVLVKYALQI
jgi:hypothetical protein